mmetsp:Transcript_46492/g.149356  ORF Transcript_46492/g.149356 Transcript_46492/m.149356 type:complete len:251 (+) Transcript_46492:857-1609(+)
MALSACRHTRPSFLKSEPPSAPSASSSSTSHLSAPLAHSQSPVQFSLPFFAHAALRWMTFEGPAVTPAASTNVAMTQTPPSPATSAPAAAATSRPAAAAAWSLGSHSHLPSQEALGLMEHDSINVISSSPAAASTPQAVVLPLPEGKLWFSMAAARSAMAASSPRPHLLSRLCHSQSPVQSGCLRPTQFSPTPNSFSASSARWPSVSPFFKTSFSGGGAGAGGLGSGLVRSTRPFTKPGGGFSMTCWTEW